MKGITPTHPCLRHATPRLSTQQTDKWLFGEHDWDDQGLHPKFAEFPEHLDPETIFSSDQIPMYEMILGDHRNEFLSIGYNLLTTMLEFAYNASNNVFSNSKNFVITFVGNEYIGDIAASIARSCRDGQGLRIRPFKEWNENEHNVFKARITHEEAWIVGANADSIYSLCETEAWVITANWEKQDRPGEFTMKFAPSKVKIEHVEAIRVPDELWECRDLPDYT